MTIFIGLPMLTFLLAYIFIDNYVKRIIPNKDLRKKFKHQNEFFLILAHLFAPIFMLQNELIFLNFSNIPCGEMQIFPFLFLIKIILFILAGQHIEAFFRNLKTNSSY